MFRKLLSKNSIRISAIVGCSVLAVNRYNELKSQNLQAAGFNYSRRYYPASSEYPDLTKNKNIMSRNMTKDLYAKLRDLRTPNGFSIDDSIQTGVDNNGTYTFSGAVAGDEDTYKIFGELFDKIIYERHNFKPTQNHVTDLDYSKLKNAHLDEDYVLNVRIKALRNIRGYCLPTFCTRGERRDVESIIAKCLYGLDEKFRGNYHPLKEANSEEEAILTAHNLWMERPYKPEETSANYGRDWPDARGIWLSSDKSLAAFINNKDHLEINVTDDGADIAKNFKTFVDFVNSLENELKSQKWSFMHNNHLGYITSDPSKLGTALKISVRIKLSNLSKDSRISALLRQLNLNPRYRIVGNQKHRLTENESIENDLNDDANISNRRTEILEISSNVTLGKSEVEVIQSFIHSINRIIETEKIIANGGTLDDVLYNKK